MARHPVEKAYFDKDYEIAEGVEDLGFQFSDNRAFSGTAPVARSSGIKGRRGNPTNEQIAFAGGLGIGYAPTDQIWTIWESTFRDDGQPVVMPLQLDIIQVLEIDANGDLVNPLNVIERWIVQWSKTTLYGAQYLCYCSASPLNIDQTGF